MQTHQNIEIAGSKELPILIDVFYEADQQAKPVVLFAHGFKGFKDWGHWDLMGKVFAQAGFVFVKFNFSHNGTTVADPLNFGDLPAFGRNNFCIELDDLGLVIDWIQGELKEMAAGELNADKINLIGHSRGGGIAILKANEDARISQLCTWASVNEFGRYWQKEEQVAKWKADGVQNVFNGRTKQDMPLYYQLYENFAANRERLDIPKAVKNLSIPFLITHGTDDKAVPYEAAQQMKEWNPQAELFTLTDANHVFGGKHPWEADTLAEDMKLLVQTTIEFFK